MLRFAPGSGSSSAGKRGLRIHFAQFCRFSLEDVDICKISSELSRISVGILQTFRDFDESGAEIAIL